MKKSMIQVSLITSLLATAGFAVADDHKAGASAGAKAGLSVGVGGLSVDAKAEAKAKAEGKAAKAKGMEMVNGEVRRVDEAKGRVMLKHGEIKSLNMSPMTMMFTAENAAMVKGLKKGDKVKFAVNADMKISVIEKQ